MKKLIAIAVFIFFATILFSQTEARLYKLEVINEKTVKKTGRIMDIKSPQYFLESLRKGDTVVVTGQLENIYSWMIVQWIPKEAILEKDLFFEGLVPVISYRNNNPDNQAVVTLKKEKKFIIKAIVL